MRVYLDNCCYNRPYDDQSNVFNLVETEAKLVIQQLIKNKKLEMVWSDVLDHENDDNPFEERRIKIAEWRKLAFTVIEMDNEIVEKARELMVLGLHQKDAAHIACAIFSQSEFFITVDRKILNKQISDIIIIDPLDFLRRTQNDD
jgi:predicted nucleic acid-binding protein